MPKFKKNNRKEITQIYTHLVFENIYKYGAGAVAQW